MTKRTLSGARAAIDALIDQGVAPMHIKVLEAELKDHTARLQAMTTAEADKRYAQLRQDRDAVGRELAEVRDDLAVLVKEGRLGRMPAADYDRARQRLLRRQQAAEAAIERFDLGVDSLASLEDDPDQWIDHLLTSIPATQPDFGF